MTALLIVGAVALVLGLAWALTEATVWWQARNDAEDATFERPDGLGDIASVPELPLSPFTPASRMKQGERR